MGLQKRERKSTGPNTLPAVCRTKGLSKSKGASQLQTGPAPPEAGGRGEGKGANSPPKTASPTTLQTVLQFLTKDFLRFWMVDIRQPEGSRRDTGRGLGLGTRRGEGTRTRGGCARQAPGCLSCSGGEGTKHRRNRVCAFVEYPKTGTAGNTGHAPYRAAGSLSSVDRENRAPTPPHPLPAAQWN